MVARALAAGVAAALIALALQGLAGASGRSDRLVTLLHGSDSARVRVQAALSLGRIGQADVVPALVLALGDESDAVRAAAAQALGRIGAPEAVAPLEGVARDAGQPALVRTEAARALALIRDARPSISA
jgi:HEAT repeat protein